MKIYNEVVIDMNPESPSYGETLHEDSYEYEGDMYLAEGTPLVPNNEIGWEDWGNWETTNYTSEYIYVDGKYYQKGEGDFGAVQYHELSENVRNVILENPDAAGIKFEGLESLPGEGTFTYDESGKFDPTSDEFRKAVQRGGGGEDQGFYELARGYGWGLGDFDKFHSAPLDYAKQQYGTGKDALGLQTGKSLGDIYGQVDEATVKSGFESSGSIDYTQTKATKGVMGDYLNQQKSLSDSLAFQTEEFWKKTEDQFYAELEENKDAT